MKFFRHAIVWTCSALFLAAPGAAPAQAGFIGTSILAGPPQQGVPGQVAGDPNFGVVTYEEEKDFDPDNFRLDGRATASVGSLKTFVSLAGGTDRIIVSRWETDDVMFHSSDPGTSFANVDFIAQLSGSLFASGGGFRGSSAEVRANIVVVQSSDTLLNARAEHEVARGHDQDGESLSVSESIGGSFVAPIGVPLNIRVNLTSQAAASEFASATSNFGSSLDFDPQLFTINTPGVTATSANLGLSGATSSAVPEPSSLALLGLGMLGLVGYRWRRQHVAA